MKILHNPRCRKSREGLQILQEQNEAFEVVEYLKTPLNSEEIKDLLAKLGIEPIALVRKGEAIWKENYKGKDMSDEDIIQAIADHPKLMERPVVIHGDKAVVGRPPELIRGLF